MADWGLGGMGPEIQVDQCALLQMPQQAAVHPEVHTGLSQGHAKAKTIGQPHHWRPYQLRQAESTSQDEESLVGRPGPQAVNRCLEKCGR